MGFRQTAAALALIAAGTLAGSMMNRPSEAQQAGTRPANASAQAGRFEMRVMPSPDSRVVVTDTATGQTWTHQSTGGPTWIDFGIPSAQSRR
jgi:hypothetical protein